MTNITVYTMRGCLACDLVKSVLMEHNQDFVEKIVGFDLSADDFKQSFPDVELVPFLIMGEEHVKYSEFLKRFKESL